MNLDTSTLAVIVSLILGVGTSAVAIIQIVANRGSQKADITDKVTEASERVLTRYDKDIARLTVASDKCEARLSVTERQLVDSQDETRRIKTAFRVYMHAVEDGDRHAIETATTAARELLQ